uniref:Uncharacterized protein n=1 Tax=Arundo donax TaxID=35708 RepID=A0A0A8XUZ6_ARUDO
MLLLVESALSSASGHTPLVPPSSAPFLPKRRPFKQPKTGATCDSIHGGGFCGPNCRDHVRGMCSCCLRRPREGHFPGIAGMFDAARMHGFLRPVFRQARPCATERSCCKITGLGPARTDALHHHPRRTAAGRW